MNIRKLVIKENSGYISEVKMFFILIIFKDYFLHILGCHNFTPESSVLGISCANLLVAIWAVLFMRGKDLWAAARNWPRQFLLGKDRMDGYCQRGQMEGCQE